MNISGPFIRRPVMTILVMMGVLLAGFAGYRLLPINDLPNVDFPTIVVNASLSGASPETMASSVATPLERQFSTIEGIDNMTSVSSLGSTQITLQFDLDRDIDAAAQDVQTAISRAVRLLPAGMPEPPSFRKVNPADQAILYLALTSRTLPIWELNEYADTIVGQRISTVRGVAQVRIFGAQKYAVRVQLNPDALASRGIAIDEVGDALREANVNLPTGTLSGPHKAFTILTTGQLYRADAYGDIIVAYRNGSPVRLEELGRVIDSVEDDETIATYVDKDGSRRAVMLAIQRQPGTNTVAVADAIKEVLPTLKSYLPLSVELHTRYDRSLSIRESIDQVKFTMVLTLGLVIMVIFLFVRKVSATIIPSLALPMSIVGTFAVMYLLGYSLNNLSLMGLILAIGFVVDDAIVMLENIVRHMEMGKNPLQAAFDGSKEIGFTIVSMTVSLAAVFIPVLFMGGVVGRLFNEFAVTICVAILISGFVSLTLTPMLCGRLMRPPREQTHGRFYAVSERFFDGMLRAYEWSLRKVLDHRPATMAINGLILLATVYFFMAAPKGFIPNEDQGSILAITESSPGTSFEQMARLQKAAVKVIQENPHIRNFFSTIGGSSGSANQGRIFLYLKPLSERPSSEEIIGQLRPKLAEIPGIRVFMQDPPEIRIGGQLTKSSYQFTLQSLNIEELYKYAPILEARLGKIPELEDVTSDLQDRNPQINVVIQRDKASVHGVTAEQVATALNNAYGNQWVSTIYAPEDQYRVVMELEPEYQRDPDALSRLYINSSNEHLVPLDAVSTITESLGPQTINHYGQFPAVTLSFNVKPGVSLGEAVEKVRDAARQVLPATMSTSFQGAAKEFQESFQGLWLLLIFCILVIYMILGILYESFVHPLTILSGLPSAGFGALLTLIIFGVDLDVYSFVGLIMLVGIVKKNAIMQIDFALEAQRKEGKSPMEAIYQGCLVRFRPIMMTTMAALLGALPLALSQGAGAESRRTLGIAVVGGLLFSQLVTLYVTPVFYTYMDTFEEKMRRFSPIRLISRLRGRISGETRVSN